MSDEALVPALKNQYGGQYQVQDERVLLDQRRLFLEKCLGPSNVHFLEEHDVRDYLNHHDDSSRLNFLYDV